MIVAQLVAFIWILSLFLVFGVCVDIMEKARRNDSRGRNIEELRAPELSHLKVGI